MLFRSGDGKGWGGLAHPSCLLSAACRERVFLIGVVIGLLSRLATLVEKFLCELGELGELIKSQK